MSFITSGSLQGQITVGIAHNKAADAGNLIPVKYGGHGPTIEQPHAKMNGESTK